MSLNHYALGSRSSFKLTSGICWRQNKHNPIVGVEAWARDERTGEYVQVLSSEPEACGWVQGEHQGHQIIGNFGTVDEAKKFASMAYRYINKGRRR